MFILEMFYADEHQKYGFLFFFFKSDKQTEWDIPAFIAAIIWKNIQAASTEYMQTFEDSLTVHLYI